MPHNRAGNQVRKENNEQCIVQQAIVQRLIPINIYEIADLREDLKDALACLSADDQTILNFYLHYGFDHNEIARILQIKPGAARTRYCRALGRLYNIWVSQDENRRGENDA